MPEARKSFLLRIDRQLWRELEGWAEDELRSVNGQVEFLLREAVRRRKSSGASVERAGTAAVSPVAGALGEGAAATTL